MIYIIRIKDINYKVINEMNVMVLDVLFENIFI